MKWNDLAWNDLNMERSDCKPRATQDGNASGGTRVRMGRLEGVGRVHDSGTVEVTEFCRGWHLWISKIKEEHLRENQRMNIVFGL